MAERPAGLGPGPAALGQARIEIRLEVAVTDAPALLAYARRRRAASWQEEEWTPADLAEAVLEALVLSNENPSPADYGIEILGSRSSPAPTGDEGCVAPRRGDGPG